MRYLMYDLTGEWSARRRGTRCIRTRDDVSHERKGSTRCVYNTSFGFFFFLISTIVAGDVSIPTNNKKTRLSLRE